MKLVMQFYSLKTVYIILYFKETFIVKALNLNLNISKFKF